MQRVRAFSPEQGANRTGLRAGIGFLQTAEFVGCGKPAPVGPPLGVRAANRGGDEYQLLHQ